MIGPSGLPAPVVMGILNVTPDSFSDGGKWADPAAAVAQGLALAAAGADIVDVGGESTRPGATPLDPAEEQRRVIPVVRELARAGLRISIDTVNAATARAALDAGAAIINDVSGGEHDPAMRETVAATGAPYVLMHSRGAAGAAAQYGDVVAEVRGELARRIELFREAGAEAAQLILDPGLGFAKDAEHNWTLLRELPALAALGHPILVGASRKRFLGALLPEGLDPSQRDLSTAVVSVLAVQAGAWGLRVHDVVGTRRALDVVAAWNGEAIPGRMSA